MTVDDFIRECRVKMITAVREYERQQTKFAPIREAYEKPGRAASDASHMAVTDYRTLNAVDLCERYRNEAVMYAAVITALRAESPIDPARIQRSGGI